MLLITKTPTNIITGFLGAGKTTFFNACLSAFVSDTSWAVLVNEIGKIGIDDKLLDKADTLAIKQISGGCICCTSQLPLQVGIATLLKQHRPDRLWIEPTGLANPAWLVGELSATHWQSALSLCAIVAILNARQWQEVRYRQHEGYQAHIVWADVVVVNRFVHLSADDKQALSDWIRQLNKQATVFWQTHKDFLPSEKMAIQDAIFAKTGKQITHRPLTLFTPKSAPAVLVDDTALMVEGYYYQSVDLHTVLGWRLPSAWRADIWQLSDYLKTLPNWLRIKGVVHTLDGWVGLNCTQDGCDSKTLDEQANNCLEVILAIDGDDWQQDFAHWGVMVEALFYHDDSDSQPNAG